MSQFERVHQFWSPEIWDDGYTDSDGRVRVYRPDYPRAYREGYALRAHVMWWLCFNQPHLLGSNLHHLNGDRTDDRIENLAAFPHGSHSKFHRRPRTRVDMQCDNCGKTFKRDIGRINSKDRQNYQGVFCSQKCYHQRPTSSQHRKAISEGLKRAYSQRVR